MSRSVAITGLGMITPVGDSAEETWRACLSPESALCAPVARSETTADCDPALDLGLRACRAALDDAGIDPTGEQARMGSTFSSSKGAVWTVERASTAVPQDPCLISPGGLATTVAARSGVRGPMLPVVTACATGLHSVIVGAHLIQSGLCDFVLAGATEASATPLILAGFERMGVLTKSIPRPFDLRRDGFVLGEGAGALVLEEYGRASERGASIYGCVAGAAMGADATGIVTSGDSGGIGRVLALAIERAGLCPREIGYVNAHGTGTAQNDPVEAEAIRLALGPAWESVPVSSTKSSTGHLLGASGAVEMGLSLLAMRDGLIPPTRGLDHEGVGCALRHVFTAEARAVNAVACLNFGFGGQIAAVVVTRSV